MLLQTHNSNPLPRIAQNQRCQWDTLYYSDRSNALCVKTLRAVPVVSTPVAKTWCSSRKQGLGLIPVMLDLHQWFNQTFPTPGNNNHLLQPPSIKESQRFTAQHHWQKQWTLGTSQHRNQTLWGEAGDQVASNSVWFTSKGREDNEK